MDDLFGGNPRGTIHPKCAQPLRANHFERRFPWEFAQTLLPKATSLQRYQAKDCQVCQLMHDVQFPTKEETASTAAAVPAVANNLGQAMPVAAFVVACAAMQHRGSK